LHSFLEVITRLTQGKISDDSGEEGWEVPKVFSLEIEDVGRESRVIKYSRVD